MEKKKLDEKIMLTKEGYEILEKELKHLKTVKRKEVAEKINQALAFGDLSENAEYEEAKNEQAFIEGRILVLEEKLMKATIVEEQTGGNSEKIHLGVRVMLENLNSGKQIEYSIVDSVGANPSLQKISFESPLAQALIGKTKGDEIELKVPAGMVKYRVIDIKKKEVNPFNHE
ncbi:transcription elongation factor GreA [Atribacter laminatus]|uniref:Transcription elongation factor GreA n=1 Tax=Atribacter laminatus TaxID=2847778 RepID=A0A7T1AJE6_ATRLM|nr:transcription elongation factor GreA [Atribacter laminatus]QPM67027.1 Transcription elongation factor GreA [Atribacter laminatus]